MKVLFDVYLCLNYKTPRRIASVCAYQSAQGVVVNRAPGVLFEPGREAIRATLPMRYRQCFGRGRRIQFAHTSSQDGWQSFGLENSKGKLVGSVWAIPFVSHGAFGAPAPA